MIKREELFLLKLVRAAIWNQNIEIEENDDINWENIRQMAREHNVSPIIFPLIKKLKEQGYNISDALYNDWNDVIVMTGALQCAKNYELNHVISVLKKHEINPVLFKGAVLASLYPEYLLRFSGDADILVTQNELKKASEVLENEGYVLNQAASKDNVPVYVKKNVLVIELHASLWEDYSGERINKLEKMNLSAEYKRYCFSGCDIECDTLGYTEHFVYIVYHIVKHFIPGGIGIRHLTDMTLYVNKYQDKINFEDFYYKMKQLGYDSFCISVFRVCIKYLGMSDVVLIKADKEFGLIEERVLEDIIDAGTFGNRTLERRKSRNIIKQTYYEKDGKKQSKFKIIINTLFPSADSLSERYVNARNHKILLPVAWVQRYFYHIKHKCKSSDEPSVIAKTRAVENRMKLLKDLKLFDS